MASLAEGPSTALGRVVKPGSGAYPCIFVNGRAAPQGVLLDEFELGDIEAIEV